jgi:uncharacterized membrane protein YpjA
MNMIYSWFANRHVILLLLLVNILGTVYGYAWYGGQLSNTPTIFLPFVPDSPTASLFFVFVLLAFTLKKNWGLMEALAMITLFKYGIWAVVMNLLTLMVNGSLGLVGYMLMLSHLGMVVQGLLYAPFYRIKPWHLVVAAIWTLHNEMIDYLFGMMPVYGDLMIYSNQIGYFTFWLSILSIWICYYFGVRKNRLQLHL